MTSSTHRSRPRSAESSNKRSRVSTDNDKGNSKHDKNEMKEPSKKRKRTQIQSTVEAASVEDTPSFQSFQLNPRVLKAVLNQFEQPTLVQATAIPLAVSGKDIVARAKTGSGKTIAYVLPVIHHILTNSKSATKGPFALVLTPTKELSAQVHQVFKDMTAYCDTLVRTINLTSGSEHVQRTQLSQSPEVIVSTPALILKHITSSNLSLQNVMSLVIDEADLVLSYGHELDLQQIFAVLPKTVQTYLMSATLTPEIHALKKSICRNPAILKLEEAEHDSDTLTQYYVECTEEDKFLLIYVILKLSLLRGRCIVFVNDVERCYRVKLFLEQFGIRSSVLNARLPLNSRLHIVDEFNKGVYDIILATDESNNSTDPSSDDEVEEATHADSEVAKKPRRHEDSEYGVSRGIDFKNVSFIINFDLPTTTKSYLHRIGRTARAGATGTSLSFIIPPAEYGKSKHASFPSTKNDTKVLARIRTRLAAAGRKDIQEYMFDPKQVDAFRYRMNDALRAVTRAAVHQAQTQELRKEILSSEKLKRHFHDNPTELDGLRHDEDTHVVRRQAHLKYVPDYLLPGGGNGPKELGFIGYKKEGDNRIRKARLQARQKRKFGGKMQKKRRDPLKSFKPGK